MSKTMTLERATDLDAAGKSVTTAGCDLLAFRGDHVVLKNAFREAQV
jgi:hypothetical protein